jgi:glycosyltransferase involved in cell wall biosynthesis
MADLDINGIYNSNVTPNLELISIVLPTFNRDSLIKNSILSVVEQSYVNWELIVVDSGSDQTEQIVSQICDPRIKYYKRVMGRSAARNFAIEIAEGKIISFIDSDDIFMPNKLQREHDVFDKNPGFGWCYSTAICRKLETKEPIGYYKAEKSGDLYKDIAYYKPLTFATSQISVRRTALPSSPFFDERLDRFEDTDFFRRTAKSSKGFAISEVLVELYTHEGNSISNELVPRTLNFISTYLQKVNSESNELSWSVKRNSSARLYSFYGAAFLSVRKKRKKSVRFYLYAIRLNPIIALDSIARNVWNILK